MAVKTYYSNDDFREILAVYPLGELIEAAPIAQGTIQTNYFLTTTQGKFVFRGYENRDEKQVRFECLVLAYLSKRGYPCARPLKNRHGAVVGMVRGKPFVIFPFLRGSPVESPNERHRQQLIDKAAELQLLTRGYRPRYTEFRWNYGPDLCRRLAREQAQRLDTPDGWEKLAWHSDQLDRLVLPRALPKGICHCDFHYSNILFEGDEFVALIDFDDANYTYLLFDLVGMMESFACNYPAEKVNLEEARRVVDEYQRIRPLNHLEQRHLFDVYKLSILIDCLWFFPRGGARDFYEKRKIEALDGLGREKFTRALFG